MPDKRVETEKRGIGEDTSKIVLCSQTLYPALHWERVGYITYSQFASNLPPKRNEDPMHVFLGTQLLICASQSGFHHETEKSISEHLRLMKLACLLPDSSTTLAGQSSLVSLLKVRIQICLSFQT